MNYIKFSFVCFTIFLYFVFTSPIYALLKLFPYGTKKVLNYLVSHFSKLLTWILGIEISHNLPREIYSKNYFIVSNHLSYIDILVISSIIPTSFVTSIEMKQTPFLGQIIQLAGCLFVERRNKKNIQGEIKDIENALEAGLNVTVFPEATSTNGEQILGFKRSLFQSAINTNSDVLPLTINYSSINGDDLSCRNRDIVFWYGDMEFFPHLWKLCQTKKIKVSITYSDIILASSHQKCSSNLRNLAYEKVTSNYFSFI